MLGSLIQRWSSMARRIDASPVSRRGWRIAPAQLFSALPELGCVLYVPMQAPRPAITAPPGLLVDDPLLAPLLQVYWLVAASTVTIDGPREWIECMDRDGRPCARLYLLPDTDYLAWDALVGGGAAPMPSTVAGWSWGARAASAQCQRFGLRHLAGLSVLGSEVSACVSNLGRQLAGRVAGAEAVPLRVAAGH